MVKRFSDQENIGKYVYKGLYYRDISNMLGSQGVELSSPVFKWTKTRGKVTEG